MESFPPDTKFKFPWRTYQARILKELEDLLVDNHLHVVAAPGSGKTVLGLEVINRLNKPTLVLAPTIAIRDQWVERLVDLFLDERKVDWISKNIKDPKFFTVSTYQGLHSAMTGKGSDQEENVSEDDNEIAPSLEMQLINESRLKEREIINDLKKVGIDVVVVDEAHHLRTHWWKSLTHCISQLDDPTILALTATPPFDVSETEWKRYRELCGPVDAEVSVPELVKEKNLCPHQDYIMFSTPSISETEKILKYRNSVKKFTRELYNNNKLILHLTNHPWVVDSDNHIEEILSNPSFFSSILVYLIHKGVNIPRSVLDIIVVSPKESIPNFDYEWLEILLMGLIFRKENQDEELPAFLEDIKRELVQIGALERRIINLRSVKEIEKILRTSISKLSSINKIVELEYGVLRDNLRMVILTDYIRKEFLPRDKDDVTPLSKIGVIPIFENIRRNLPIGLKLGILSGSIVAIPTTSQNELKKCIVDCEINLSSVKIKLLPHSGEYSLIDIKGINKNKIVQVMTKLFTRGGINVLVGTIALLGEGWDAPSINSLLLASFVGSYMLSNQMRGRAIRTEPNNPNKTANVWHLACLEPRSSTESIQDEYEVNEDLNTILRRFRSFVGVSFKEPIIESGVSRLNIGKPPFTEQQIERMNEMMNNRAVNREQMRKEWETALKKGEAGIKLIENIKLKKEHIPQGIIIGNSIENIFRQGLFLVFFVVCLALNIFGEAIFKSFYSSLEIFFFILLVITFFVSLISLPRFLRSLWLLLKHGTVKSSLSQITKALLKTLCFTTIIKTDYENLEVKIENMDDDSIYCHLEGATNREKVLFLESLQEIFDPIENPRYLLIRKSFIANSIGLIDYHAIPTIIGAKKRNALLFAEMWEKYVGHMELIYTRTRSGRGLLLKARTHSLSSSFLSPTERISRWC